MGLATYPNLPYTSPHLPEVGQEPEYLQIETNPVVGSLATTLENVTIQPYESAPNGLLGNLLLGALSLDITGALQGVVSGVLADALDPVLDDLLPALGIDLAAAEVGANLSCDAGSAILVD